MVKICLYSPQDQAALLALVERSNSTNRTPATWQGNPMAAILAWDGDNLIGALPMERRVMRLGRGAVAKVLWISAAHVDEAYRAQGIGMKMDSFARDHFAAHFDAFFVYREDENSLAYNWYRKMGYFPILPILAFSKDVGGVDIAEKSVVIESVEEAKQHGTALLACFETVTGQGGGYPIRAPGYWQRLFTAHYYKTYYAYSIIALPTDDGTSFDAYALLGRTNMRDGVDRFDILEFVADAGPAADRLHNAVEHRAQAMGLVNVRLQTAAAEPLRWWAEQNGYVSRGRRTNIMASLIDARAYLEGRVGGKALALSIETPARGQMMVTQNGAILSLFMSDETLHQLAFNRLDVAVAVNEGRIAVLRGDGNGVSILGQVFGPATWRYLQADYI